MSTMLVYRVEDDSQRGPYVWHGELTEAQEELRDRLHDAHSGAKARRTHPGPGVDKGLRRNHKFVYWSKNYVFGFTSREQMARWFGGWGADLEAAGYSVGVYRVPVEDVIASDHQATFNYGGMEHLLTLPASKVIP